MTTKDEALQMAPEALTCNVDDDEDDSGHRCGHRRRTATTEHDLQHEYDKYRVLK